MEEIKNSSKKKKYIFVTLAIVIAAVSILTIIGALWKNSDNGPTPTGRDWAVSMLNPKNYKEVTKDNSYYTFINKYEQEIKKPASTKSNEEFDNLYDNETNDKEWQSFSSLETALTTTKLSDAVTTKFDWNDLFKKVNLSNASIKKMQAALLRFYNILSKLYNKDNILRLIQKSFFEVIESRTIAYTHYLFGTLKATGTKVGLQRMVFGQAFADTKVINRNYDAGYFSSNNLLHVPIHEYGHAVSNFLAADTEIKENFNTINWPEENSKQNKLNLERDSISQYTQLLMDYLNKKAGITENDNTKKTLFPLIVVRSNYGRSYWLEHDKSKGDEYFAEAFSEWLNTPKNQRTWNWELLNNFFMKELPKDFPKA